MKLLPVVDRRREIAVVTYRKEYDKDTAGRRKDQSLLKRQGVSRKSGENTDLKPTSTGRKWPPDSKQHNGRKERGVKAKKREIVGRGK